MIRGDKPLLGSQRVLPQRLLDSNYVCQFGDAERA